MSNAVACIVVSIWENACDRQVLARELQQNYVNTELALEQDAVLPKAPAAAALHTVALH
jgi:aerobic C4-dicarboxylate transport protein